MPRTAIARYKARQRYIKANLIRLSPGISGDLFIPYFLFSVLYLKLEQLLWKYVWKLHRYA